MGQALSCCTVAKEESNDDTMYCRPPQEIEQPWKEKIETDELQAMKAILEAMQTDLEALHQILQKMKILTSIQ